VPLVNARLGDGHEVTRCRRDSQWPPALASITGTCPHALQNTIAFSNAVCSRSFTKPKSSRESLAPLATVDFEFWCFSVCQSEALAECSHTEVTFLILYHRSSVLTPVNLQVQKRAFIVYVRTVYSVLYVLQRGLRKSIQSRIKPTAYRVS
jgi:hypothetical protein